MRQNTMRPAGSPNPSISTTAAWIMTALPRWCWYRSRVPRLQQKPVYLLGAAVGSGHRTGAMPHNSPLYASASFDTVAPDLYRMAGLGPSDVVQAYENFTGGMAMALAEHGFFKPEEANEFLTLENLIAPSGRLPLDTSGGNLAECYMHGFELVLEAVRQGCGTSSRQVKRNDVAMVIGGPMRSAISFWVRMLRYERQRKSHLSSFRAPDSRA